MDERFNQFIPQVHFELIPIRNLVSNQEYQRSISEKQVLHAAENFDVNQINPVKVSRRNGMNYVFNGQHTIEIVAMVSGSRDTPVWCMIYDDLEYTHEADIFANQSKYVRPLTPYDIFTANIEAGNQEQLIIKELVERVRKNTDVPCAVGFGISTPEQAAEMAAISDGAIVGSAIVRQIQDAGEGAVEAIRTYAGAMAKAVHKSK